jgi:hypothetical protein
MPSPTSSDRSRFRLPGAVLLAAVLALGGCDSAQKKREEELAKNTFACQLKGERFVVRFADAEARILLPGAQPQRVTLYQLPATTGNVWYSNGRMELRGKGSELQFAEDGVVTPLHDCEPYAVLPSPNQ